MDTQSVLFIVFSACALLAGLRVITARNPVHAVLFLVLAFFSSACLWMQLRAEFLAIVLILVYVGAVMVLFLFVVMMLDINIDRTRAGFWRHLPAALLVAIAIALQLWLVLSHGSWQALNEAPVARGGGGGNTAALGRLAFTDYLLPLQVAGAVLLVAIVAAITLTLRQRKDVRRQNPAEQVAVRRSDRLTIVRMPAETGQATPGPAVEVKSSSS
ncbi:MAG TPA: NADH-quinone oxidoreductase subunit J [Burkholderiaceae bacterium]|jgi:NADH-quinone oxidoreductase subunit J|nr:NADH-quinone oxidoreductase subunit J [Burkholderiaceae bacterium]